MANNQKKPEEVKNEEIQELVEEAKANKPNVEIVVPEKKGLKGWFKELSTPAKVIAGVVTTALIGAAGYGVKVLIDVLTGGEDSEDDLMEAEEESPADE